jgi:hypothetical protein
MGISANQARFLSLTARQCDLEYRMQDICRRRTRLSQALTDAATAYNNQTSDRRLFINSVNANTSGTSTGSITHDNLSDNQQYDYITASNLYDNGYYLFMNGTLLDPNDDGTITQRTGNTANFDQNTIGTHTIGDWYKPAGDLSYRVVSIQYTPATPVINTPTAGESGTPGTPSYSTPITGDPNTTPSYTAWAASGGIQQDPVTGVATQTFKRMGSVEEATAPITTTVKITQEQNSDLGSPTSQVTINGVVFNQYTYTDYAGRSVTSLAIGDVGATQADKNAQAISQLNALAGATGTVNNNFILMTDVDMSSAGNWGIIDNLAGTFDGNMHTISNLTINVNDPDSTTTPPTPVGMFGSISSTGKVKNLSLNNESVTVNTGTLQGGWNQAANYNYIGGIAGLNDGQVSNCSTNNLDMVVDGPGVKVGGIVGQSGNTNANSELTNCSASGTIAITGDGHQVGGLAGISSGGDILFSSSNVNIYTDATLDGSGNVTSYGFGSSTHIGALIGDVDYSGLTTNSIQYCYASGLINGDNKGIESSTSTAAISIAPPQSLGGRNIISNSYYGTPGIPTTLAVYDSTPSAAPDAGATWSSISGATTTIAGQTVNVWNSDGTLNQDAINTEQGTFPGKRTKTWEETKTVTVSPGTNHIYTCDEYETSAMTSEQLEAGLRSGTVQLATDADMLTQNPVEYEYIKGTKQNFEFVDWRTAPVISDDLDTTNDEQAQTTYEHTITDVNGQDKLLELEQQNIETEYTAITSEKEAVKKVLDNNAQNSFKYFG